MQVAVVGAGLAGLSAARDLEAAGHSVVVWEKSRGSGGRTATRRGPDSLRFDHGAPFLHDGERPLGGVAGLAECTVSLPDGSESAATVGAGANNGPAKLLAGAVEVRSGRQIAQLTRAGAGWALSDDTGGSLGAADAVIVTAPAPQAAELLRAAAPALADRAASVAFSPCWAVMAAWEQELGLPFTAARDEPGLAWAVAERCKPGRIDAERWVLQAPTTWSQDHLEDDAESVAAALLERFAELAGSPLPEPAHLAAHRWRFARPSNPLAEAFLREGALLAAGDWCGGATAGAAIRSGRAAAAALAS